MSFFSQVAALDVGPDVSARTSWFPFSFLLYYSGLCWRLDVSFAQVELVVMPDVEPLLALQDAVLAVVMLDVEPRQILALQDAVLVAVMPDVQPRSLLALLDVALDVSDDACVIRLSWSFVLIPLCSCYNIVIKVEQDVAPEAAHMHRCHLLLTKFLASLSPTNLDGTRRVERKQSPLQLSVRVSCPTCCKADSPLPLVGLI
jgi:hypothetical protein